MPEPSFFKSLLVCDDASSLRTERGNWFIRKLPNDKSLSYLHKLHTPLTSAQLKKLEVEVGRDFPEQFRNFLLWSNGASFFDNCIYIFGRVCRISRSLSLDEQQPISLASGNAKFSLAHRQRWESGWMLVGSIVGWDANHSIELHTSGACALVSSHGTFLRDTFEECLTTIIDRVGTCYSCDGLISSHAELEAIIASIPHTQ